MRLSVLFVGQAGSGRAYLESLQRCDGEVKVKRVLTLSELDAALDAAEWDLLVLDYSSQIAQKVDIAFFSRQYGIQLPVIVLLAGGDTSLAEQLLSAGASSVVRTNDPDDFYLQVLQTLSNGQRVTKRLSEKNELLDRLPQAIVICGYDGCISYWSRGAEQLYGFSASHALGRGVDTLLPDDSKESFQAVRRVVWDKGEWIGKLPQMGRDGKQFTVLSRSSIILGENGHPEALLMINTKVGDGDMSEELYIRSQRLECIGTLAGGLAHDLNNVFTPILMASFLLRSRTDDPAIMKMVDTLEVSAQRGADIVKQVMTIAQGEEGEHKLLQIKHILRDITNIAKETFPKNATVRSDLPKDLPPINADATQIQQMVLNIALNARDAVEIQGDEICLEAEVVDLDESFVAHYPDCDAAGTYIRIGISDNGSGITREDLDRVFDPFFTTRGIGTHTGLGLSTARAIARGHGGFITITSTLKQGTQVDTYLPVPEDTDASVKKYETTEECYLGHGETILIIDDEAAFRTLAKQALYESGYEVLTASNGAEGVAVLATHSSEIKVVVTDLVMPVMDGVATMTALRKIKPDVRLIAISGYSQSGMVENAKKIADFFIPRPFTANKLLEVIRKLILIQSVSVK